MTTTPEATTARRKRLSLTKTDLQTSAGIELLAVLQDVTSDGHLSSDEVKTLQTWLAANEMIELPSRSYLLSAINDVLRDGVITDDEFDLLHDAVLRVLPVELRSIATLRRREHRRTGKDAAKRQAAEEKQRQREERDRNRPLDRADFMIAGATIGTDRRRACEECCEDDPVSLVREPDNAHDANAIQIVTSEGALLGYVPRDLAADLARLLDFGARQDFRVKKLLHVSSGRVIPVVVGALYRGDAHTGHVQSMLTRSAHAEDDSLNEGAGLRGVAALTTRIANPPRPTTPTDTVIISRTQPWTTFDVALWLGCAVTFIGLLGLVVYVLQVQ